jgi:peptidoglycan hydrolase-like protein with peptidoglycan-binding domain
MYPRSSNHLLSADGLKRFDEAYTDKKRPIGWWERNSEAAGLVQCYLHILGYSMKKSVKVETSPVTREPDGIFGQESVNAVWKFQKDNQLTADGMVGQETFDKMAKLLDKPRVSHSFVREVIIDKHPRKCRPNELICADPDAK